MVTQPPWEDPVAPTWAGLAVRLADGSTFVVELTTELKVQVSYDYQGRDCDRYDPYLDAIGVHPRVSGTPHVTVTLSGHGDRVTTWATTARDAIPPVPPMVRGLPELEA